MNLERAPSASEGLNVVLIDGAERSAADAKVSVYDRGFLYGDSVFETMRTYGGRVFALREHLERLAWSAGKVLITMPIALDALASEIEGAVRLAGNDESYVRVMITRGSGPLGLDPALAEHPLRVVIVEPLVAPADAVYEQGIDVILVEAGRPADGTAAAGAKIGNYLPAVLAISEAKRRGAIEALFVDGAGHVHEGATSNVFVLTTSGELVTPPLSTGILPGVTRRHVLEIAKRLGVVVVERVIQRGEIATVREMFVCSSIREIVPVVRVDGQPIGAAVPGPVTRSLLTEFRRRVRAG